MNFRQSAVSSLTRDEIVESSPEMPKDIMPALIGSGKIALGIDASGLQGLNACMRQYRDTFSLTHAPSLTQDSLYVFRDQAVSKHLQRQKNDRAGERSFSLMPGGWLDFILVIDGIKYDMDRLSAVSVNWQRVFCPVDGILTTSYDIENVRLTWQAGLAPNDVKLDLSLTIQSIDDKPHDVNIVLYCMQTDRIGHSLSIIDMPVIKNSDMIFRSWNASSDTSAAELLESVNLSWAVGCSDTAEYNFTPEYLSCRWQSDGLSMKTGFCFVFGSDRDKTDSLDYARSCMKQFKATAWTDLLQPCSEKWNSVFSDRADIQIGDPEREFLFLMQQYVLQAGFPWSSGLPLSSLWNQTFVAATFWDSFFAADGMLRCGYIELVRKFCDWLLTSIQPTDRPHFWMTYYDGTPVSTADKAYQVVLAYAGICIRLYESTRDPDDLNLRVLPYLRRTASYFIDNIIKTENGQWYLDGSVTGDVEATEMTASQEHGILLWTVVTLAKYAEYADLNQSFDDLAQACKDIAQWYKDHPVNLEQPCMWDVWLPYLIGNSPFANMNSWRRFSVNRIKQTSFSRFTMQPWFNLSDSAALSIAHMPEAALQYQEDALNFVSGIGYFNETPFDQRSGGCPPYLPACGSWLSSLSLFFAYGSYWSDRVDICMNLPDSWQFKQLKWKNIQTQNGVKTSGTYSSWKIDCSLETRRPAKIRVLLPARMAGEPALIMVNGKPQKTQMADTYVEFNLDKGSHTICVKRDMTKISDILVVEPHNCGAKLTKILTDCGLNVRWLRNYDDLKVFNNSCKVALINVSHVWLPESTVMQLQEMAAQGKTIITMYHAGCSDVDSLLADLTGVCAGIKGDYWSDSSQNRTYQLTQIGQEQFPDMKPELQMPDCGHLYPKPADDLSVLAVDNDDGRPVLTVRKHGEGKLYWIATGSKLMGIGKINFSEAGYNLWVHGQDIQDKASLDWLSSFDFKHLLQTIATKEVHKL